jgi:DNA-binding SARP family transcriptional activator
MYVASVQLLGRPRARLDGVEVGAPKGAKVWGLLAYLAASERSHPRSELAELLFGEAADPLGALRWNLAAARRLLDRPDAFKGDAIRLDRSDIEVDTVRLDAGDVGMLLAGESGWELLAGLTFPDSPVFELWLISERQRLRRRALSLMREVSLEAFARGDHDRAIRAATNLVTAEPFDEGHHALLIRTLALSGEHAAARRQFEQCATFLRRELQTEPGPAVFAAAHLATFPGKPSSRPDYDEVCARMNVAWQSFLAGAIDHGIDMARSTVMLSDGHGDSTLRVIGRVYLAAMLNMAVRGWDETVTTAAAALHLAEQDGMETEQGIARGVLAGGELMRGDYRVALDHAAAGAKVSDDPGALALNFAFMSAVESDTGQFGQARGHALEAVSLAERSGDPVRMAYAYSYAAHADILVGRYESARPHVERAIESCSSVLVLKPWPMTMLAEIQVHAGDIGGSVVTATRADGLAIATAMSYQRALAQRALALGEAAAGDDAAALGRLALALGHARRTSGQGYSFHWPVAWVLESLACIAARSQPTEAQRWAVALKDHAAATGMTSFATRVDSLLALTGAT